MGEHRTRLFWSLCGVFGAGVIGFAVWFGGVIPNKTCTGSLPQGVSALLVYQFARTPADIESVFGSADDPCRALMIEAMDRANRVDLAGFIVTYSAFLLCFFLALRQPETSLAARLGLIAVVATAAFDVLETATQLHITSILPGTSLSLTLLTISSRGKFIGLAIVAVCAGWAMMQRGKMLSHLTGAICIAAAAMSLAGTLSAQARPLLSLGGAVAWILMLLYALQAAARGAQNETVDSKS